MDAIDIPGGKEFLIIIVRCGMYCEYEFNP